MTLPPAHLPDPYRNEYVAAKALLSALEDDVDWHAVESRALPWVSAVRAHPPPFWALESLLREFPISSAEGLALMRLAEALLRVPDIETAAALAADQLRRAPFDGAEGGSHAILTTLSSTVISLAKNFLAEVDDGRSDLLGKLGAHIVVGAAVRAIQLLGKQFVLGRDIHEALREAQAQRRVRFAARFSFDMLGEGARTEEDARRYLNAYHQAIQALAAHNTGSGPQDGDGISIKLSALFSRYESAQHARVMDELMPRLLFLQDAAAKANLNLTIDAEESDRLELSLNVLERLAHHVKSGHPSWSGLGLAIQAYQTRAHDTVEFVADLARRCDIRLMVRLVKGAYWDGEIKRAQELGMPAYPVFTHKHHTDVSYLACAQALFSKDERLFPQFATHNAGTIAAIIEMADAYHRGFEFQRLHGMGEGIYREVLKTHPEIALRTYAPVGEHRDLLAYLVRRLLENGANNSFVHQLSDVGIDPDTLLRSPLRAERDGTQILPVALYAPHRLNTRGIDLSCRIQAQPLLDALQHTKLPRVDPTEMAQVSTLMTDLHRYWPDWDREPINSRAGNVARAGDLLEARLQQFSALLCIEGGKTLNDAVAEVREAVDFCRYYASEARTKLASQSLQGPTGESNELRLRGRGVFVCISPWNFPLAIFAGQVVAALLTGNTVAAKSAEQTPAVARAFVDLLHEAGVPNEAVSLLHGPGETVGAALVADPHCAGVCFTGSTEVAKLISRTLASKPGPIVPFIAETGGLNTMIVDSSALPEQVVDAVVQSAFRSAGQRCSALRLLCLHESIADHVIDMLAGAMQQLTVGDPSELSTDVGPIIDAQAHAVLTSQIERLHREARLLASTPMDEALRSTHIMPVAFEVAQVSDLKDEVFGPVLQVTRWRGEIEDLVREINALGYGLTLGIHTRIDSRAEKVATVARVGNVYVNRNMIGAVVGVQPFGGEGLSGTGPKAGGPHYLFRFCAEQTLTTNTAAAGGNVALLV